MELPRTPEGEPVIIAEGEPLLGWHRDGLQNWHMVVSLVMGVLYPNSWIVFVREDIPLKLG